MSTSNDPRLLLLDPRDNVLVAAARLRAGETVSFEGWSVVIPAADVPLGHKLARRDIAMGEKIVKYDAPIGSATAAIRAGEHAHVHNIKSDYTPTYHLEDIRKDTPKAHDPATAISAATAARASATSIVVGYLVECAHHVAREIAIPFRDRDVHVIGFPGCYPNSYAEQMMERLCTHPNVGAVLLVSLGCESFNKYRLEHAVGESGRPVQHARHPGGGRHAEVDRRGPRLHRRAARRARRAGPVPMAVDELIVGTVCGGSDATSGLTANPAAGRAFDLLVARRRRLHLRGDRRADRLRAHHGEPRDHARARPRARGQRRQGRPLLRHAGLRLASPPATPRAA